METHQFAFLPLHRSELVKKCYDVRSVTYSLAVSPGSGGLRSRTPKAPAMDAMEQAQQYRPPNAF
jgi:hypothetical protein